MKTRDEIAYEHLGIILGSMLKGAYGAAWLEMPAVFELAIQNAYLLADKIIAAVEVVDEHRT